MIKQVKNFPNIKLNSYDGYKFVNNKEAIEERVIGGVGFYTIINENEIISLTIRENFISSKKTTKKLIEYKTVTDYKITYSNNIIFDYENKKNTVKIYVGKDINEYEYNHEKYDTKVPINSSRLFDPLNFNDYELFVLDKHKNLGTEI